MDYDRLRELQEKFDENPRRYFAPLANEYRKGGQPKRAIEICRAHLAQMPGHMSGQIVFGQALFEAGEWAEARTVFERALTLDPENLIGLRSLGDMALQAGNTAEARSWYSRLLDADPKDAAVIALVTQIDASAEAAASPPTEDIPGVDPNRGNQQIAAVAEEEPATYESSIPETAETANESAAAAATEPEPTIEAASPSESTVADEVPFAVEAAPTDTEVPAGLERHYPVESVEEQPEPVVEPEPVEEPSLAQQREEPEPISATPEPAVASQGTTSTGASSEPFVNETMAQLYLQQGYRQLALKVYRQLAASRPHDQAMRDRIAEIEAADAADHPEDVPSMWREEPSIQRPTAPAESRSPSIEYSAREEPRAEPEGIAARQPSIREFFATLGRRRPPRASGNPATRSGNNLQPDAGRALGNPAPPASLDTVFAGATVSPSDARAASRLAGAFSGATGGTRTPQTPAMPTPRVNPRLPQTQESEEDVAKFRAWLDGLTRE